MKRLSEMMTGNTFFILILTAGCICGTGAQINCQDRDEVSAGRTCQRPCRPDGTCRKQNRECICDGRCGLSCLLKTCPPPADPESGSVVINPIERIVRSVATYSCDNGYVLVGNTTRICQSNKTWSGTEPTCQVSLARQDHLTSTCARLAPPSNGVVDILHGGVGDVPEGTVARFECNNGYSRTSGNIRRICQADGSWSGTDVVCSEDVECARNDVEVRNQNRRCMRQCESNSDCLRDRRCVCDDICGLSCIRTDRANLCEDLQSNQRVRVRITPNNRTFGSIALSQCRSGHDEIGGSNEIRCLGSGQWSGEPLNCIPRVRCDQPPEVENSGHNGTKEYYVEGDIVMYRCDYGYYRSGYLPLSRCNRDEWSEIQFQCEPKSCGDPGLITDGQRHGSSFVFLGSVEYTCNEGYELRGLSRRYCQANQEWSGYLPTCHPVRCPALDHPENGRKIGNDYTYNKIVSFECNTRYIMEGENQLRCQANGTWDGSQPTCRLIRCPRPDDPENGSSDADLAFYGYQGTVRFTCHHGYTRRGSAVITCDENEEWSPSPPLCMGQCVIPSCPRNGYWTISHGRWNNCPQNRMVDPGFHLTYQCDRNYFKCQQVTLECFDRQWEPNVQPLCKPVGCRPMTINDPQLTANYTYDGEDDCNNPTYYQRGTIIHYSCNLGYEIRYGDPHNARCIHRSWQQTRQPSCVEVQCPPIVISNGEARFQQNGPFRSLRGHTSVAHFFCSAGYILDGRTSVSCNNGIWNDTFPRCIEEPCLTSRLNRYYMGVEYENHQGSVIPENGYTPHGTTARFICELRGFEAIQRKTCRLGSWEGDDPECVRVPCIHELLVNGNVRYTLDDVERLGPVHGVVRTFTCNPGFELSNEEQSLCHIGVWTRELPVCIEKPCDSNDVLNSDWDVEYDYSAARGVVAQVMKPPGTVATFRCRATGYVIVGDTTRSCRQGRWSAQNPSCERSTCPVLSLDHGRMVYQDISGVIIPRPRHGDYYTATCNNGYRLHGISSTCWEGEWQNESPTCQEKYCDITDLPRGDWEIQFVHPEGGNEAQGMKSPGTEAIFLCNVVGYVISGENTTFCRLGEWSGLVPLCERRRCPKVELPNGRFIYRDINNTEIDEPRHRDYRRAICSTGHSLRGELLTECWNGEWGAELPTCNEDPCRVHEEDDVPDYLVMTYEARNGSRIYPDDGLVHSRTIATFSCKENGTRIREGSERVMCKRGTWKGQFPECENATCTVEIIENGRVVRDGSEPFAQEASHGDWRNFTCEMGYTILGQERSQCLAGEWTAEKPTCVEVLCANETINNGNVARSDGNSFTQAASHGDLRRFSCEEGYHLVGQSLSICQFGEWNPEKPTCEAVTCSIETIVHGDVTQHNGEPFIQEASYGNWRNFTCWLGYRIVGEARSQCGNDGWTEEKPTCELARCTIETIVNGGVTDFAGRPFTQDASQGDWRHFTCEQGYTMVGSDLSQCFHGEWDAEKPFCREDPCSALANNGEYANIYYQGRLSDEPSFPANTLLEVDCAEGSVAEGPITSFCRRGSWVPPRIFCVDATASCDEQPAEERRNIVYSDNSGDQKQHGSSLQVTCEQNMVMFGPNTSTCLNGLWDPPVAHCRENLALGKNAWQDTTDHEGDAGRAVDGNTDGVYLSGRSCTHTRRNGGNHYWYVDLGQSYLIQEIFIYNRQDPELHTRLLDAKVRVGDHGGSGVVHNELVYTVNDTSSNPIRIVLSPAIEGQRVSVSELNGIPLTLCEVQVFEKPRACPEGCELPHLENGYFTLQNNPREQRLQAMQCVPTGHVYMHCQDRLHLHPRVQYSYRCKPSGVWERPTGVFSSCHLCPEGHCVVPYIENGQYSLRWGRSALANGSCLRTQEYLYLACDGGAQLVGRNWYGCSNGQWQTGNEDNDLSTCTTGHLCAEGQCVVPYIENGQYSRSRGGSALANGTCLRTGRILYLACNDEAQLVGRYWYGCSNGQWQTGNTADNLSTCTRATSICPMPEEDDLVEIFVGGDYTPISGQHSFIEGDIITSRCQDPQRQTFSGSVIRRCEEGQWSGSPAHCESTDIRMFVTNTVLQEVAENGTMVVFAVTGYVKIHCQDRLGSAVNMYKNSEQLRTRMSNNERSHRHFTINDPSATNSGTYRCHTFGQSHSIDISFKAITCPPPEVPDRGRWDHDRAKANSDGDLGYIFTETLSLSCDDGYQPSDTSSARCTYHGTWDNISQRCIPSALTGH